MLFRSDFMRSGKIQQLLDLIKKLYTAPEEVQLLEKMLGAETDEELNAIIEEEPKMKSDDMRALVTSLIEEGTAQNSLRPEMIEKLNRIQKAIA